MLNYIWGGLIIISLVFAIVQDTADLMTDRYLNSKPWEVEIKFPEDADKERRQSVRLGLPDNSEAITATWRPVDDQTEVIISVTDKLPKHWQDVAQEQEARDKNTLRAILKDFDSQTGMATIVLPEVRFVKIRAIQTAAFDMAEFAVTLAIGLIGIMALWLGLMQIAKEAGLINLIVKAVQPFMRYLFPNVPKDHPALGMISLNLSANVLGLGNAATPLGIKAMEELQKINPNKDEASNAMCMFLTLNTSSVQLLPPATLVAIMGLGVNELIVSITLATAVATIVGVIAAKWYARKYPEPSLIENGEEN